MKGKIGAVIMAISLLAGGCTWNESNYVSITPHLDQQTPARQEIIRATNYAELCTALTDLVDSAATSGIISVAEYSVGKSQQDMERAVAYVCGEFPMGAYAVEHINYETGTRGGLAAFAVTISYRHTPAEMKKIRSTSGAEGVRSAIYAALNQLDTALVIQINHFEETDFQQLVEDYALQNPNVVMEVPQVSVGFYPDSGTSRMAEFTFTYTTSRDALRGMRSEVQSLFDAAKIYVSEDASDHEKSTQLYSFLVERYDYKLDTSITPAYSLLRHGVGDSRAFAMVYGAMCRSVGLDCRMVGGTRDGVSWFWNVLQEDDTYYHVDLVHSMENGHFLQLADEEMAGYVWDYSAVPPCGIPVSTEPDYPPNIFMY